VRYVFPMTTASGSESNGSAPVVPRDLNSVAPHIETDHGYDWSLRSRSLTSQSICAFFGDLKPALLQFIEESYALVGCVAWLTDFDILSALARQPVALVVQKEDFLRPDLHSGPGWNRSLREKYDLLHSNLTRMEFPAPLSHASYADDPGLDPIRCVGNHNQERSPAAPRMHHKFLIRIAPPDAGVTDYEPLKAESVWTGSFNFSLNASRSFENAVIIEDDYVAGAYLDEFARVAALSEPLDWQSSWVQPQWRIGT
jgi:hypothetical protein